MHTDARTLDAGTLIEGDLCIVGAGAAGISMALDWAGTRRRVVLLEGGGFDLDPEMQDLYRGENVGQPYYPLEAARLHVFGGTTGHWAGFCSTFDPVDFKDREWVPYSGWPITREELDPFYARAQRVLELGPYEYGAAYWEAQHPDGLRLPLDEEVVWTKMWQFSPPTRFGTRYREAVVSAPDVHLYTYANVTEIEANEPVTAVAGLRVKTIDGKEHRVRARHYVLACCALQNARLLLASNRQAPAGLGNDRDLVGRYFMEHLEMPGAQLVLAETRPLKLYDFANFMEKRPMGELALSEKAQREHRILNGTASLHPGAPGEEIKGTFQVITPEVLEAFRAMERGEQPEEGVLPDFGPSPGSERAFTLHARQEQSPNPNSRVSLSEEKDALGMPRVKLDWQLTELEKRSMRVFYEVLGREVGRRGLGRVQLMDWLLADDHTWPDFVSGGWHHHGTTRMHEDPAQGVVDADCKVHGLANLHTAGSSAFPTAGCANPTLTLVALTLRLSDHLKTVVG